ncbi:hypothetical protein CIB95_04265 [Lottiidibacillus patelloidae]|uniref:Uncharacterized protein n=1 Tax=Lottiidibacillus patelloidae TaxID=2670334 RepID=A0A263BV15_9BACI|nr:hypothetical protein [Lottiidibacillus patelloidae]OZM57591.1 hypothetical protein CIB95_04265 [Lottiidibacillus patelloidae]
MKKFSLWLSVFSILICIFNAIGLDDKNLLLFLSSPHLMFLEDYSHYIRKIDNYTLQMIILYLINIFGWFLIGALIDIIILKLKRFSLKKGGKNTCQ